MTQTPQIARYLATRVGPAIEKEVDDFIQFLVANPSAIVEALPDGIPAAAPNSEALEHAIVKVVQEMTDPFEAFDFIEVLRQELDSPFIIDIQDAFDLHRAGVMPGGAIG